MTTDAFEASGTAAQGDPVVLAGPRPLAESVNAFAALDPIRVAVVAESAEAVIETLDAPAAARPGLFVTSDHDELLRRHESSIRLSDYARAVLYNGLGHYRAARAAASRACADDGFDLLDGALLELVEASVRSGFVDDARAASARLDGRASTSGSAWSNGLAACARALVSDEVSAERNYVDALDRLRATEARVASARAHLLFGEWLRRRGRRVDARSHLARAHHVFHDVGLGGFAERARRELLATVPTARRRSDETRLALTAREAQIARLVAERCSNPEIGERLFLSPRTVEWHLRKIFAKFNVASRRELAAVVEDLGLDATS
jgi:DNA-binding CsgD family transcriptional regulator